MQLPGLGDHALSEGSKVSVTEKYRLTILSSRGTRAVNKAE